MPAAAAQIPVRNKMFTKIQTVESISLGISSFLCDLNQVCFALEFFVNPPFLGFFKSYRKES